MPVRIALFVVKDQSRHIVQRGNGKDVIFAHEADYPFFLEYLSEAVEAIQLKIRAYVLKNNHDDLLASPLHEYRIAKSL